MSAKANQDDFYKETLKNMKDFSISLEVSLKMTLRQFEAQGVDISDLVTDPAIFGNDNSVKKIKDLFLMEDDDTKKVKLVEKLKKLVKSDVGCRLCCEKFNIFGMCFDTLMEDDTSLPLKNSLLDFLIVFLDGYPHLADEAGCLYFLLLLDEENEFQTYGYKLLCLTSLNHESNRQFYWKKNVIEKISEVVRKEPNDDVLLHVCKFIITMTGSDDVGDENSKAYLYGSKFADALLKPFCRFLKVRKEPTTLYYLLKAMSRMIVDFEYIAYVEEQGGLPAVMYILVNNRDNEPVVTQCFKVLTRLAGSIDVKHKLMKCEIAEELCLSLHNNINEGENVTAVLKLVSKISERSPEYGKLFFKMDFPELIVQAMQIHTDNYLVQGAGCSCVQNMSARNPEFHNQFISLGIVEILKKIKKTHVLFDAITALQELGFDVATELCASKEEDILDHTSN